MSAFSLNRILKNRIAGGLMLTIKVASILLLVTHTLQQALRIADHVIFMYLGEVIESGPAEQIFNNPKQELTQKYLEGAFS